MKTFVLHANVCCTLSSGLLQSPFHNASICILLLFLIFSVFYCRKIDSVHIGYQDTIQLKAAVANMATTPNTTIHTVISPIEYTSMLRIDYANGR